MLPDRFVVPFKRWHYDWLDSSGSSDGGQRMVLSDDVLSNLESQNSWTGVVAGVPIACGGTMRQWTGRHIAWAYLGRKTGPHMTWITRHAKKTLSSISGRIELTVREDFPAGMRWARMLGFEVESFMPAYGPEGEGHFMYVRFE